MARGMKIEEIQDVEGKVVELIKENCDLMEVGLETELRDELDSLEFVELGMIMEVVFGVDLLDEDLADIYTVKDFIDFIESQ